MVYDYGYGICTDKLSLKDKYWEKMPGFLPPKMKADYDGFMEDNRNDPSASREYFDEYESDMQAWSGPFAMLADFINEKEAIKYGFIHEDAFLYVRATLPHDKGSRKDILSEKQVEDLLRKYVPLITEGETEVIYDFISD